MDFDLLFPWLRASIHYQKNLVKLKRKGWDWYGYYVGEEKEGDVTGN